MESDDPFERHAQRTSLANAGVLVLVISVDGTDRADRIAKGLIDLLAERGHSAIAEIVQADKWFGLPREDAFHIQAAQDLILVTTATEPWTPAHLDPLLTAIDRSDHVLGRRRQDSSASLARWLTHLPWKWLFAVPVVDVHSPCRLHRREALEAIPLQSRSRFADIEILAKATFLGHLIDEEAVPPLPGQCLGRWWSDFVRVLRHPTFTRETSPASSGPTEEPQSQQESDDRPGGEDRQRGGDLGQSGPFEQNHAVGGDKLRQG